MSQRGVTIIEVLIVISILAILSILVLSVLNPLEQIHRAEDTATLLTAETVYNGIDRSYSWNRSLWQTELMGISLDSTEGHAVLDSLVAHNEIKKSFPQQYTSKLGNIFLSGSTDLVHYSLCFSPKSKAFKQKPQTHFSKSGEPVTDCQQEECFYCVTSYSTGALASNPDAPDIEGNNQPSGGGSVETEETAETSETEPDCSMDPEYPNYPFTCNYSTKWSEYGCTNYCVIDQGCRTGDCPEGYRKLVKVYGPGQFSTPAEVENCIMHWRETTEYYCSPPEYARCDLKYWGSSDLDYDYGCVDPVRPIKWKGE